MHTLARFPTKTGTLIVVGHRDGVVEVVEPGRHRVTATLDGAFTRLLTRLAEAAGRENLRELNPVTGLYSCDVVTLVAAWFTEAGLRHTFDGLTRQVLLRVRPEPGHYNRTLLLETGAGQVTFHESYQLAGTQDRAFLHSVTAQADALPEAIAVDADLPFRANRDRVHAQLRRRG